MKPKVYIETSIVSYLTARISRDLIVAANQQVTQDWWEKRRDDFDLFVSLLVVREASAGDEEAARSRLEVLDPIPLLLTNAEVEALADALIDQGALPASAADDAFHIAIAAVHRMDYLLGIANGTRRANAESRKRVVTICRLEGYDPPIICTPAGLMGGGWRWKDPIVEEVRRIREQHAARFGYDLNRISRNLKEEERRSR